MRVFIARSDPALNYGLITAVLLAKVALSKLSQVQKKTGVRMNPILGVGTMPFRGHLNPDNIENFLAEYKGLSTVTVQSAFRYDYPERRRREGDRDPQPAPPQRRTVGGRRGAGPASSRAAMKKLIPVFQSRVEILAPLINYVASVHPDEEGPQAAHRTLRLQQEGQGRRRCPGPSPSPPPSTRWASRPSSSAPRRSVPDGQGVRGREAAATRASSSTTAWLARWSRGRRSTSSSTSTT